jgi:hypothetical protein
LLRIPSEKTLWQVAAIGFGLITGVAVIFIMQYLNLILFPVPETMTLSDETDYSRFIKQHPPFLVGVFTANAAGCLVAGGLAKIVRHDLNASHSLLSGLILMMLGYVNFLIVPHPWWFLALSLFAYVPFSWLGFKLVEKQTSNN